MAITAEAAMLRLADVRTVDQLTALIDEIDVEVPGGRTMLFSGDFAYKTATGSPAIKSFEIAGTLAAGHPSLLFTNELPIGRFLDREKGSKRSNELLIQKLDELFDGDQAKINEYFYGTRDANGNRVPSGIWDRVSARFAAAARGEVLTLTAGARLDGVFAQTELAVLLANPNVTRVDGIPITLLRRLGTRKAFELITANSEIRIAQLGIAVDAAGQPLKTGGLYQLDSRRFLPDLPPVDPPPLPQGASFRPFGTFLPTDRFRSHQQTLRQYRSLLVAEKLGFHQVHQLLSRVEVSRLLNQLDQGLLVLGLAIAGLDAKAALARGDRAGAEAIISRWARETAGAFAGAELASLLATPLLAAGPIGALVAAGLVTAGGIAGASLVGGPAGEAALAAFTTAMASLTEEAIQRLQDLFAVAEGTLSPLVLDLDGNGVITRAIGAAAIHFDHDANGFAERTGWVGDGDALLVRDLDGDGRISSGLELFGNGTRLSDGSLARHGFDALGRLNHNRDGQIDHRDAAWAELMLWRDADADAETDSGELLSLDAMGVKSISLAYGESPWIDPQGNRHRQIGSYRDSQGRDRSCVDVWFTVDATRSRQLLLLPVPTALAALPDLPGMGIVPSLHQVMAADPTSPLSALLEQWVVGNSVQREALLQPILLAWTGVQNVLPASGDADAFRRLRAMERLMGRHFRNVVLNEVPQGWVLPEIEKAFAALRISIDRLLTAQVELQPFLRRLIPLPGSGELRVDVGPALAALAADSGPQPDGGALVRLTTSLSRMGPLGTAIREALRLEIAGRLDPFSVTLAAALESQSLVVGSGGVDSLIGAAANDWIQADQGSDSLRGLDGDDVLQGGPGDDLLAGGAGNDLYLVGRGDGADTIWEWDNSQDEIRWLDVGSAAIRIERLNNDLVFGHDGDRVRVLNYFGHTASRVERFRFSDGVVWTDADLSARIWVGGASDGADQLGGFTDMPNRIDGLAGDDTLRGGSLADWLSGGSGNDRLEAGFGNDTLIGGGGNDVLVGGSGDDEYRISRGGWSSTIHDYEPLTNHPNADAVLFTNLRSTEVKGVERQGNDLTVRFGSGDRVRVQGYFTFPSTRIESFRFCDGVVWSEAALRDRVVVVGATVGADRLGGYGGMPNRIDGLAGDDSLYGAELADRLIGGTGADLLVGYAGNDALNGGSGDDRLDGGFGDDSLIGGSGNDLLEAGFGNDTLIGGGGNDVLVGGSGDDEYRISRGGWSSTIHDYEPLTNHPNADAVLFTNLRSTEVMGVERQSNDLTVRFGSGDRVRVQGYFTFPSTRIESFRFCDGVVWGEGAIVDQLSTSTGP